MSVYLCSTCNNGTVDCTEETNCKCIITTSGPFTSLSFSLFFPLSLSPLPPSSSSHDHYHDHDHDCDHDDDNEDDHDCDHDEDYLIIYPVVAGVIVLLLVVIVITAMVIVSVCVLYMYLGILIYCERASEVHTHSM